MATERERLELPFKEDGLGGLRIAIVGSRGWRFPDWISEMVRNIGPFTLVSGGAKGPDRIAEGVCRALDYPEPMIYLPDWKGKGRAAGFDRNTTIIEMSSMTVAFWDSKSNGTRDTMKKTYRAGKPLFIVESVFTMESKATKEVPLVRLFNAKALEELNVGCDLESWESDRRILESKGDGPEAS